MAQNIKDFKLDDFFYFKAINVFKKIEEEILNSKLEATCIYYNTDLNMLYELITTFVKENKKKGYRIDTEYYFLQKIMSMIMFNLNENDFEKNWAEFKIKNIFINNGKIKPNDIIDYRIIQFYYYNDLKFYDNFISFDNNVKDILKTTHCDTFNRAITLINSFSVK